MAGNNYLSSVKISGVDYDIYAASAGWVPVSAIDGKIDGSAISGHISADVISAVPSTALPTIPPSAISDTSIPWSALEPHTATSSTTATDKIWTTSATMDYVTDYVAGKISNVYKFKGTCAIGNLPQNPENGDVWDLSDAGAINPTNPSHSARVEIGDNVAWVSDGQYWDKLASNVNLSDKLAISAFTAWSANANSDSQFLGSSNSALTSNWALNVSGSSGGTTATADGYSLIQSAQSGAEAWTWISGFTASGQPIVGVDDSYLSGDGTTASKLGLKAPNTTLTTSTDTSALVNAGAITSYLSSNYLEKKDIYADTNNHQLVIDNI